ncbi:cyclin-dependent kinase 2-associated protein 1 isoform X1 [Rhineura floridana]|uniref:cyclin-dependent kinase 2-associated protein 1 isoform X1 n=2 Tax=Rhineura floridana TaxID=261503 RepID=UPI002AC88D0F|nr:cyclin-dependent kinase 2-associated protein 1 isoform X1 [Rhineura floridana]
MSLLLLGMSYKPNLNAHVSAAAAAVPISQAGSVHSPSTSMAGSGQYRHLINDYGPPSLGYTQGGQGTSSSQVPQSKYAELLAIIEELGKEIRPTYAGSKSAMERLKRGIIHARGLVRECLAETERNARS